MKEPLLASSEPDPSREPRASEPLPRFRPGRLRSVETPAPVAATTQPAAATPPAVTGPRPAGAAPAVFGVGFTRLLLVVCVLMFGMIIGMKVSDYFHGRYFEQQELTLLSKALRSGGGLPEMPGETSGGSRLPAPRVPETAVAAVAPMAAPQNPGGITDSTLSGGTAGMTGMAGGTGASSAAAEAGNTADYRDQLEALRQERQLMTQRFERLNGIGAEPGGNSSGPAPVPGGAGRTAALEAERMEMLGGSDPLGPAVTSLDPAQVRIRDAPAIATVKEYDNDWHFVVLDGGKRRNLEVGRQLAVRRGHEILGLIRLDEVLEDESVGELDGTWKNDREAEKPRSGDTVIPYPLF